VQASRVRGCQVQSLPTLGLYTKYLVHFIYITLQSYHLTHSYFFLIYSLTRHTHSPLPRPIHWAIYCKHFEIRTWISIHFKSAVSHPLSVLYNIYTYRIQSIHACIEQFYYTNIDRQTDRQIRIQHIVLHTESDTEIQAGRK